MRHHGSRPVRRRRRTSPSPIRAWWRSACRVASSTRCLRRSASRCASGRPAAGRSRRQRAGAVGRAHRHRAVASPGVDQRPRRRSAPRSRPRSAASSATPDRTGSSWSTARMPAHCPSVASTSGGPTASANRRSPVRRGRRFRETAFPRRAAPGGASTPASSSTATRTRTVRPRRAPPPNCCATARTWCTASSTRTSWPSAPSSTTTHWRTAGRCRPIHRSIRTSSTS